MIANLSVIGVLQIVYLLIDRINGRDIGVVEPGVNLYLSVNRLGTDMPQTTGDTEDRILDLAEVMIRTRGYNGFSFREIASDVGVKSSSVHYYFPTKADLGARVARRYSDRFLKALGDPQEAPRNAAEVLEKMHRSFARALGADGQMCLCDVLAAEAAGLPAAVAEEAPEFFSRTSGWLHRSLQRTEWGRSRSHEDIERQSLTVLAQLEGGLLIARVQGNPELFEQLKPELP